MSDLPQSSEEDVNPLFNQSLEKGLAVLQAFSAQRNSMTLAEVAQAAQSSKSSAQRMVYTLEQLGFTRRPAVTSSPPTCCEWATATLLPTP